MRFFFAGQQRAGFKSEDRATPRSAPTARRTSFLCRRWRLWRRVAWTSPPCSRNSTFFLKTTSPACEIPETANIMPIPSSARMYFRFFSSLVFMGRVFPHRSGPDANARMRRVVKAVICAAFYPNVVRVKLPEKKYVASVGGTVAKVRTQFQAPLKFTLTTGFVCRSAIARRRRRRATR